MAGNIHQSSVKLGTRSAERNKRKQHRVFVSSVPHSAFRVPRSNQSRRPELNQLFRVFSAALYQLSYTGMRVSNCHVASLTF